LEVGHTMSSKSNAKSSIKIPNYFKYHYYLFNFHVDHLTLLNFSEISDYNTLKLNHVSSQTNQFNPILGTDYSLFQNLP